MYRWESVFSCYIRLAYDWSSPCGPPSKRRQRLLFKGQILRQNLSWVWNIFGKKRRNSPPPFPLWSQTYLKRKGTILQVPLPPFLLLVADNGRRWGWKTFREPGRLATCHCYLFFQNCTIFSPFQTIILLHKFSTSCALLVFRCSKAAFSWKSEGDGAKHVFAK